MSLKFGIEEEVFIVDKGKPAIDSLYPLYSLVRSNPSFYYLHTAVNMARGRDLLDFFVASVEISTGVAGSPEEAVEQLKFIRMDFLKNCPQKVACVGMLPNLTENESLVSGLHIHLSGDFDLERKRMQIAYYLPALMLITANSPSLSNDFLSNRALKNPFSGVVLFDSYERFQDIIISRRLKTLEIRVFDPCPELKRYLVLLKVLEQIVKDEEEVEFEAVSYSQLREESAKFGMESEQVRSLVRKLCERFGLDESLFATPPAIWTRKVFSEHDEDSAYRILDEAYRQGIQFEGSQLPKALRAIVGFVGYYIPRLPYTTYKFLKEHGYL